MPKYARPTSYDGRQGNQKFTGAARAATASEAAAATSKDLYISPVTLASAVGDLVPSATTLVEGVVLLTDNSSPVATKAYADGLAIAGAPNWSETVSGIGQLSTQAEAEGATNDDTAMTPLKVAQQLASPPAIGGTAAAAGSFTTLGATGLASLSGSATITTGVTALNLASDASTGAVNVGTGAGARTITIGNVTGATAVAINTGTGHFTVTTTGAGDIILNSDDTMLLDSDGVLELNSSAGVISIGNDDVDQNINLGSDGERVITVGSNNGAAQVDIESGSGGVNIGTAASAQSVSIGNNTGATAIALEVGTGNFTLDGVGASTYGIGSATTTGTITIGGTAQTGLLTLGDSSGTNTVAIGSGEGATTVAIAGGATAGKTVTIADGAVANSVTIGSVTGASSISLLVGTGNFSLDGNAASTYTVGASTTTGTISIGGTAQTGTITLGDSSGTNIVQIGSGEGATTVAIAGGATSGKTVTIADGAVANSVTIGSVTGASSLDLLCGTGNFTLEGDVASTYSISATGANTGTITIGGGTGAQTLNLMTGGTGVKTSNIGTGAIGNIVTIGSVTGASSLDLKVGTGNFTLEGNVASTYEISSTGANTGTCKFASGTGARTVEIAGGGTGIKTINIGAAATADVITIGTTTGAGSTTLAAGSGGIVHTGPCVFTPDAITSDNAGVAASVSTFLTQITTDGDSNLDNVTLADGVDGQIKMFAVVAAGNAADSVKITPANMAGGTQITFSADPTGLGCTMAFDGTNWTVVANNGGTIA